MGQSKYYIVSKGWEDVAIFDINGNQITKECFNWIYSYGLVEGKSEYYLAKRDGRWAIFDKDGNMITPEWFDEVFSISFVEGEIDYYIARKNDVCAVYYKDGKKVSDDFPIEEIKKAEKINFNENLGVVELFDENENLIESIDFNPVYPFKEELIDYTKLLNI
jgi:hypothetical protein